MNLAELKAHVRHLRDHTPVGTMVRLPFARLRDVGVVLPRSIYQHLPHHGDFEARCRGGSSFRMTAYGDVIENSVYWAGLEGFEPETIAPWLDLARSARVVLDIGANTGLYSLVAACVAPDARVHAFEPLARVAERLRRNCRLNPAFRINVHQAAVGATTGTAAIYDPGGDNCYSASLNPAFLDAPEKTRYDVDIVTIDELFTDEPVDLIKLDVEGFEEFALAGMARTIQRCRPAMMMEYLTEENAALNRILEELMSSGYELHHLYRTGMRRSKTLRRSPEAMNVLFIPPERVTASMARSMVGAGSMAASVAR